MNHGTYYLEAKVASKVGKDIVKKEIIINDSGEENTTITLDKGIYKPGDDVFYRALTTNKNGDTPIQEEVNVSIFDGNNNKVYNENFKTSEYGIIGGKFTLANEVNSGTYKLVVKTENNEQTKQFKVNPYVTPKYEVNINYDKENYIVGDTPQVSINSKYFFGEPVQNASLKVYLDNQEVGNLITNDQGNAEIKLKIEKAKKYNIRVEAVDQSNYYVEKESSFIVGTDIFNIQLLPEYGTLVKGKSNDIYVYTSNNDGTPLKTYVTVSSDRFTKQIATDENGLGKFSVDIDEGNSSQKNDYYVYNNSLSKRFSVKAEDMNKRTLEKEINLSVEKKDILVATNKVKYEQGEDINLKIQSNTDYSKNIYFIKNNKIIKTITTESDQTSVNLGEEYGLIDVIIRDNSQGAYYYYNNKNNFKKTIFIKPNKELKINIGTDKEEYKPGENISILFDTKNENNTEVEAALLVSMLDNSILNLASNDLSIDNIKLALEDISFSDELDAATLYSCIINDASEQTLTALLLKQNNRDVGISEKTYNGYNERSKSIFKAIMCILVIVIIVIIILSIKFEGVRKGFVDVLTFFTLFYAVNSLLFTLLNNMSTDLDILPGAYIGLIVVEILFHILVMSKLGNKIDRTTISICCTGLLFFVTYLIFEFLIDSIILINIIIAIFAISLIIGAIIVRVNEKKTNHGKVFYELVYIYKYIGALIVSSIIAIVLLSIFKVSRNGELYISLVIIFTYILNYFFNGLRKERKKDSKAQKTRTVEIVIASVGATIIVLGIILFMITRTAAGPVVGNRYSANDYGGVDIPSAEGATTNNSSSKESVLDFAQEFMNKGKSTNEYDANQNVYNNVQSVVNEEQKQEESTDNNIRNVFLESMCFVPELITQNGNAKLNLKLSDNITSWTIQTVGNTKDGRIGYESIDSIKVFKDFFVDFELPKNMIETDNISIPVTVYNYTENAISTKIVIKEEEWFELENNNIDVNIEAKSTGMVYVPIKVLKAGNNKFRAEVSSNTLTDIVEKECTVSPKGYKVAKVVSTGRLDKDIDEDILLLDEIVENSANVKVKIYPNAMSQTIEGMENIFRMPTGCFEQVSSSLYPNILALKYMEDNGIVNEELRNKAISYISSGYQKLLTYEVMGESGGYSLYGKSPAETVLTAYGLMEISDLSEVYKVDEKVIEKMTNFLYNKQNNNGSFTITGYNKGGASSTTNVSLNAYIIWALSESNPKDERLKKSVEYLKKELDKIDDNYTLALVANTLANIHDKDLNNLLKRLVNNVKVDGSKAYLATNSVDYYGSRYNGQTIQTAALTSMALSKASYNPDTNRTLINYLIDQKDTNGTWYSTQATILALRAININNDKSKLENQTIAVRLNSEEQKAEIKDNPIGLYEFNFKNINKENKLNIDIERGSAYYEVVEEYYIPFEKVDSKADKIELKVDGNFELNVNDILNAKLQIINRSGNSIENGMITISIPQGFTVVEESLSKLEESGIIEKYEMTYNKVNVYLRRINTNQIINLETSFRASYPVEITGLDTRAYDYYNPEIEGKTMPVEIKVHK